MIYTQLYIYILSTQIYVVQGKLLVSLTITGFEKFPGLSHDVFFLPELAKVLPEIRRREGVRILDYCIKLRTDKLDNILGRFEVRETTDKRFLECVISLFALDEALNWSKRLRKGLLMILIGFS